MAYHSSSYSAALALAALALIWLPAPAPAAPVSCSQALEYLMPCQSFLMGLAEISSPCCQGAQALAQAAVSQTDRKSVCQCLKQIASSINVNQNKAKQLPQLCNIDVPVPVQPDINCDTIPSNGVVYKVNRYADFEMKAFRPTTVGNSQGMGHGSQSTPLSEEAESVGKRGREALCIGCKN